MKYFFACCLIVLCLPSKAQGILDTIANVYLSNANQLHSSEQIENYRALINLPVRTEIVGGIKSWAADFKFTVPAADNAPGLLSVTYKKNSAAKSNFIEDVFKAYSALMPQEGLPPNSIVNGIEKTTDVHGCFMFYKSTNFIYLYMLTQPNMDFVWVVIEIGNLTDSQKEALARDFIRNTTFLY